MLVVLAFQTEKTHILWTPKKNQSMWSKRKPDESQHKTIPYESQRKTKPYESQHKTKPDESQCKAKLEAGETQFSAIPIETSNYILSLQFELLESCHAENVEKEIFEAPIVKGIPAGWEDY